jgi:hypothetical protein
MIDLYARQPLARITFFAVIMPAMPQSQSDSVKVSILHEHVHVSYALREPQHYPKLIGHVFPPSTLQFVRVVVHKPILQVSLLSKMIFFSQCLHSCILHASARLCSG